MIKQRMWSEIRNACRVGRLCYEKIPQQEAEVESEAFEKLSYSLCTNETSLSPYFVYVLLILCPQLHVDTGYEYLLAAGMIDPNGDKISKLSNVRPYRSLKGDHSDASSHHFSTSGGESTSGPRTSTETKQ